MDCPRCESALDAFRLEGREAVICRECGYVGIETDHRPEPTEVEPWSDALQRFRTSDADAETDGSDAPQDSS